MALTITLSIEETGNLLQVAPTFAGSSTLAIVVAGVTREIVVLLTGT